MSYDKTNTGAIWPNKNRKTDKHPSHTGSVNVDGVEYNVSGWVGDKTKNQPSLSFRLTKKEAKTEKEEKPFQKVDLNDVPF